MKTVQIPEIKNSGHPEIRDGSIREPKRSVTLRGVLSVFFECVLIGFSLFAAFVIQKTYFDLGDHQFLIGPGELFRMSMGIACCYAFIAVLRRGYVIRIRHRVMDIFKQTCRFVVETYIFYLALLLVVNNINFISTKLALGSSFILSIILLFLYGFFFGPIFYRKEVYPARRKITLKKSSPPIVSESGSRFAVKKIEKLSAFPPENTIPDSGRVEKNSDESFRDRGGSVLSEYTADRKVPD